MALLIAHLAQCVYLWLKSRSATGRPSRRHTEASSFVSEAGEVSEPFVESGLLVNSANGGGEMLSAGHENPFEEFELRRASDAGPDPDPDAGPDPGRYSEPESLVHEQQPSQIPLLLPRVAASVSEQCMRSAVDANGPVSRSRERAGVQSYRESADVPRESLAERPESQFKSVEFGKLARKRALLSAQWRAAIAQARLAASLFLPALIVLSLLYYYTQFDQRSKLALFDSFYFGYITISTIGMQCAKEFICLFILTR